MSWWVIAIFCHKLINGHLPTGLLHTGQTSGKESILMFLKTSPFKDLNKGNADMDDPYLFVNKTICRTYLLLRQTRHLLTDLRILLIIYFSLVFMFNWNSKEMLFLAKPVKLTLLGKMSWSSKASLTYTSTYFKCMWNQSITFVTPSQCRNFWQLTMKCPLYDLCLNIRLLWWCKSKTSHSASINPWSEIKSHQ